MTVLTVHGVSAQTSWITPLIPTEYAASVDIVAFQGDLVVLLNNGRMDRFDRSWNVIQRSIGPRGQYITKVFVEDDLLVVLAGRRLYWSLDGVQWTLIESDDCTASLDVDGRVSVLFMSSVGRLQRQGQTVSIYRDIIYNRPIPDLPDHFARLGDTIVFPERHTGPSNIEIRIGLDIDTTLEVSSGEIIWCLGVAMDGTLYSVTTGSILRRRVRGSLRGSDLRKTWSQVPVLDRHRITSAPKPVNLDGKWRILMPITLDDSIACLVDIDDMSVVMRLPGRSNGRVLRSFCSVNDTLYVSTANGCHLTVVRGEIIDTAESVLALDEIPYVTNAAFRDDFPRGLMTIADVDRRARRYYHTDSTMAREIKIGSGPEERAQLGFLQSLLVDDTGDTVAVCDSAVMRVSESFQDRFVRVEPRPGPPSVLTSVNGHVYFTGRIPSFIHRLATPSSRTTTSRLQAGEGGIAALTVVDGHVIIHMDSLVQYTLRDTIDWTESLRTPRMSGNQHRILPYDEESFEVISVWRNDLDFDDYVVRERRYVTGATVQRDSVRLPTPILCCSIYIEAIGDTIVVVNPALGLVYVTTRTAFVSFSRIPDNIMYPLSEVGTEVSTIGLQQGSTSIRIIHAPRRAIQHITINSPVTSVPITPTTNISTEPTSWNPSTPLADDVKIVTVQGKVLPHHKMFTMNDYVRMYGPCVLFYHPAYEPSAQLHCGR